MNRRIIVFLAASLLATLRAASATDAVIDVPHATPVLPDGECEASEWRDARTIALAEGAVLLVKQAGDFAFMCVRPPKETWFGVDFYLARPGESPFNLHASAKLGERRWRDGQWGDFEWWTNDGWIANTSRGISFEKREFLPDSAKEFQILKSRLGAEPLRLMVEIHGESAVVSPRQAKVDDSSTWLTLRFD
jgi:hypothetical protein